MRLCAVTLLASAGFAAAVSPHALGGATQTDPEPTTTAPPPDPAPTTVPRPDPAPPPAPPPRQAPAPEPAPAPQPAPPPPVTPPSPPPPVPVAEAASAPTPPPAAPKPRRRSRVVRRVEATPKPARPLAPRVAALRFGERIRHTTEEAGDPLADAALVALPVRQSATERTTAQSIASLAILAALGLGALLLAFSAVPGTVLARSPHGFAVVRARVEIGLIGGAIVILSGAIFLVGS